MRVLTLAAALLFAGVAIAEPKGYWVPMVSPDGTVYEIKILATDAAKARVIMCVPIDATRFRCLIKQDADGAYGFVTIFLEPDAQEGT